MFILGEKEYSGSIKPLLISFVFVFFSLERIGTGQDILSTVLGFIVLGERQGFLGVVWLGERSLPVL